MCLSTISKGGHEKVACADIKEATWQESGPGGKAKSSELVDTVEISVQVVCARCEETVVWRETMNVVVVRINRKGAQR